MVNQKYSKPLFHFIRYFNEIIEFYNVKFTRSVSSKDRAGREFLEIDSNSTFSKNKYFEDLNFLIIFSVSYNNVVVTKQIYFSPTLLKSSVQISWV